MHVSRSSRVRAISKHLPLILPARIRNLELPTIAGPMKIGHPGGLVGNLGQQIQSGLNMSGMHGMVGTASGSPDPPASPAAHAIETLLKRGHTIDRLSSDDLSNIEACIDELRMQKEASEPECKKARCAAQKAYEPAIAAAAAAAGKDLSKNTDKPQDNSTATTSKDTKSHRTIQQT